MSGASISRVAVAVGLAAALGCRTRPYQIEGENLADFAVAVDFSIPQDITHFPDFAPPPDLLLPFVCRDIYTVDATTHELFGFDAREGWPGWDRIEAHLPQSDRQDLIIDLRSLTQGLGSYEAAFSHMAELTGRAAEDVVKAAKAA